MAVCSIVLACTAAVYDPGIRNHTICSAEQLHKDNSLRLRNPVLQLLYVNLFQDCPRHEQPNTGQLETFDPCH
jgi:hypothetical protein